MTGESAVKRLAKSRSDRIIDGVCGGVAEYFGIDPTLVRIATVLLVFMGGLGFLLYIAAMILMPTGSPSAEPAVGGGEKAPVRSNTTFWAVLLIALGSFWLMGNLGFGFWRQWWHVPWGAALPIILIIAGIAFLVGNGRSPAPQPAGTPADAGGPGGPSATTRLYRSRADSKLFGVCGGIAAYVNTDPTLVRILFVLAGFASAGFMLLLYVILAIVVPKEPSAAPVAQPQGS